MARTKRTITQRDFSQMVVRADLLERDDTEIRKRSLKDGRNLRALASGAFEARWGTNSIIDSPSARQVMEIRPADGVAFLMILTDTSIQLVPEGMGAPIVVSPVPWTNASQVWVEPFRDRTILGGPMRPHVLSYSGGTFSLTPFQFEDAPGGERAQPYWSFRPGTRIQASGYTGAVTLTYFATAGGSGTSLPAEIPVGTRIRYNFREIELTSSSAGTVVSRLPTSYDVQVFTPGQFRVGEVVIGNDTGWQGYIVEIASDILKCVTLQVFGGPTVGEFISGPGGTSEVLAATGLAAPLASPIWDEPLINPYKGWPRAAASVSGRLCFLDLPGALDVIAVSSARSIGDFTVGQEDDDAIVRAIGDNAPRLLHAVNAGDLVILSDKGCYYVPTRETGILTPATFNPVRFDRRGASAIRPAQIDDGVAFIDASGKKLMAALLDGNIYLKWTLQDLSVLAPDLIRDPVMLCPPPVDSDAPEKYVLLVNADGTITAAAWQDALGPQSVGFCLWETAGQYLAAGPAFGSYVTIVTRNSVRRVEQFDEDTYLDSAFAWTGAPVNLGSFPSVSIYANGATLGPFPVVGGNPVGMPTPQIGWQLGIDFTASATFWPEEVIDSGRNGTFDAKVIRFGVSVQETRALQIRTNRTTRTIGGYGFGDDLSAPPPAHTTRFLAPVFGTRTHPELEVIKSQPGPWRILAAIHEVQA